MCKQKEDFSDIARVDSPPGRELPYKRGGDARRKFWIKPLKEINLGVAQSFFRPLKETILIFCYMNGVI